MTRPKDRTLVLSEQGHATGAVGEHDVTVMESGEPDGRTEPSVQHRVPLGLDRFVFLEVLGEGRTGVVRRAYDVSLRREVALKVLRSRRLGSRGATALREQARAIARLTHPNIVSVYDIVEDGDRLAVTMEYIQGSTLAHWLATERDRGPTWREILEIFIHAGSGLAALHRASLVHGGFRAEKVLVGHGGRVALSSFGRSHRDYERLSSDPTSDQFAFCVALWQALCGSPPWPAGEERLQQAPVWPRHTSRRHIPHALARVLERGLDPAPGRRWLTMPDLLAALSATLRTRHRSEVLVPAAALVLASAGFAWTWYARHSARCSSGHERMAAIWNDDRRAVLERAFVGSELAYAVNVANRTRRELDRYASDWLAHYRTICNARAQSSFERDRKLSCLLRSELEFAATLDVLADGGAGVVERAVNLTDALPPPARCHIADSPGLALPSDPLAQDRIERARPHLVAARTAERAGRYPAARAELEAATALLSEVEFVPIHAELGLRTASVLEQQGRYEAAAAALDQTIPLALASGDPQLAVDSLALVATVVGRDQGRLREAEPNANMARAIAIADTDPALEGHARNTLASLIHDGGRYSEAEAEFQRARELLERAFGPRHLSVLQTRSNLASALEMQGRYHAAEREHRAVLAARLTAFGPEHPEVAQSYNNLGVVLYYQGRDREAEPEFRRAVALFERTLGPEHPRVGFARNNLGAVLAALGDLEQAEAEHRRALALRRKAHGPDHPRVAESHNNLGNALLEQGDRERAEHHYRAAIHIYEQAFGPEHPRAADTRTNLAALLHGRGDYARAEHEYRGVLAVYEHIFDPHNPALANACQGLGISLVAQGREREARAHLERAWSIRSSQTTPSGQLGETAYQLARVLWPLVGERRRALELADTAIEALEAGGPLYRPKLREAEAWLAARRN